MNELLALNEHSQKRRHEDMKFHAALVGADIDSTKEDFEARKVRAMIKAQGGDPEANNVSDLSGQVAAEVGFGVNIDGGLAYAVE